MARSKSTRTAPRTVQTFSEALAALELAAEDNAREGDRETAVAALRDAVSMFKAVSGAPGAVPNAFDLSNELDQRLREARATLDLLTILVSIGECRAEHLESLFGDTLPTVTNGIMEKVEQAIELARALFAALKPTLAKGAA